MNSPSSTSSTGNILIVDDTPDNLRLLSEMLSKRGYSVRSAISGSAAFMAVNTKLPDLILLDINMPHMNGYEVCNQLKANELTRDIPVLFLSAFNQAIDKVKAFQVGGLDYITKPFQVEEVLARVDTHLTLNRTKKELQQARAEALRALEQEKELHRLKSEFMSLVTHDFHTPLVSIQGFTSLLRQGCKTLPFETQHRYFNKIDALVAHLMYLLEQVLLIGKSEFGKLQCYPTIFNLESFCRELIDSLQIADDIPAIEFFYTSENNTVELDPTLLRQILINLLSNAIKYSPENSSICLTVQCQNDEIALIVQDRGIGIPTEEQTHLFQPFYRCSNVKSVRGSGLGLAVVKTCIDAHNGSIQITSKVGQGTIVKVTLPQVLNKIIPT
ncbi:MAG: response regulator [Actinomycetota bacterium]